MLYSWNLLLTWHLQLFCHIFGLLLFLWFVYFLVTCICKVSFAWLLSFFTLNKCFIFYIEKNRLIKHCHWQWTTDVFPLTSSIAFCERWTLGNAYKDPVTSLHVIPSVEFNIEVVVLAFLWYESKMAIFSYGMKVGMLNVISIVTSMIIIMMYKKTHSWNKLKTNKVGLYLKIDDLSEILFD